MRRLVALLLMLASSLPASAQTANTAAQTKRSPAEVSIAQAQKMIEKNPKNFEAYNALALALSRRARETSNVNLYSQAEDALQKSFEISPENFNGEKIRIWILLGKHEFATALAEAKRLSKKTPDDVMLYGFLTDANAELGNYKEAEAAAQWMLDLRPGNLPALTRAAYLRELYGDIEGALELMNMAYQSTPPSEVEDAAWILTQMGHLDLAVGKIDQAEKFLQQALAMFSGYHYALGNLAKVRVAQGRYAEAVELLRQRYQATAHPENLYALAEALERAGQSEAAKTAFVEFEQKALREIDWADNANRELIFYHADHAGRPAEALRIARLEVARRHDVYTLDAYAWALHRNGQSAEARKQLQAALVVGIRDAKLLYHAGAIAAQLDDRASAARYLKQSLDLDPRSECAPAVRAALEKLAPASGDAAP